VSDESASPVEADLAFLLGRRDRAGRMAERLRWTALRVGLGAEEARLLADSFLEGMRHRARVIPDDHHPDYLHPARTALILLDDMEVRDPAVLSAAVLSDTSRPDLAATEAEVLRIAGPEAARIAGSLPPGSADPRDLTETLVTAPPGVLALYLAGQLDHARHLHLGDPAGWLQGYERVIAFFLPLAQRCHPLLAMRFERWARAFRRRFLRGSVPGTGSPIEP